MQEIKLTVTIDEANLILDALGNQPFNKVFALIGKIQQQASAQLGDNGAGAKADGTKVEKSKE